MVGVFVLVFVGVCVGVIELVGVCVIVGVGVGVTKQVDMAIMTPSESV
jgi:hypothetical protein